MGGTAATQYYSSTATRSPNVYFRVGSPVEVCVNEEGWKGVFFTGVVYSLTTPKSGPRKGLKQVCVQYDDLLAHEGGTEKLKEYIDVACVRPVPPFQEFWDRLEPGDTVDAFYNDGWWMGTVKSVLEDERCIVTFRDPPDENVFGRADLRVHWDWADGVWSRCVNQRKAGSIFRVDSAVEVSPDGVDNWDVWFPGRILRVEANGKFSVQYGDANAGIHKTIVDSRFLRPPPPRLKCKSYNLSEQVDAYFDSGWWNGIVTLFMEDGKVGVTLKQGKMKDGFHDSELRPHMEWTNGKWCISSQGHHSDDGIHAHGISENHTAPVSTIYSNGCDSGKSSFYDRIKSFASSDRSLGSSLDLVSTLKRKAKPHATKKTFRTVSPCLNVGTYSSQPEVKKLLLMNSSEKHVRNQNAAEVTDYPVIIALPSAESGSGNANDGRVSHLSITQTPSGEKRNDPQVVDVERYNEEPTEIASVKRKRRRPRRFEGEGMQIHAKSHFHKEDDHAAMIPALGCEEIDILPSDANMNLGNEENNHTDSNMLREESSVVKSRKTGVDIEDDEIPDHVEDEPLSKWIKDLQYPPRKNGESTEEKCDFEVETPENIGEQLERVVQQTMQSPSKLDGSTTAVPPATASLPQLEKDIASKVATPEHVGKQLECPERDIAPSGEQSLPFVKTSSLWSTFELMEAFQVMPQRPHFKPLAESKEGFREGLAIGFMVTFSSVVERTSRLQISDPESVEDDLLEILADLERHGFDVSTIQNRVSRLRELKQRHKKMRQESNELKDQVLEDKDELSVIEEKIISNAKCIEELQAKQLQLTATREIISNRIASGATRAKETEEGINYTASMFEALVASARDCA